MSYIPHREEDRRRMLDAIGVGGIDDLMEEVPEELRFCDELPLGRALSQQELIEEIDRAAARCAGSTVDAFLGGGIYDHYTPSLAEATMARPEFYSAYTPYQAEVSQGTLQAMFEFQSLLCDLTAMPLANASLYDGATALVEALWMAVSEGKGRTSVVVPRTLNPRYRAVLHSHVAGRMTLDEVDVDGRGRIDEAALAAALSDDTAAVVVQNPNYFGHLEDVRAVSEAAHGAGALLIHVFEPVSLALLEPPGAAGADIAVGEGRALGSPINFGGPLIGLFTCAERFLRKMPGRLSGLTEDQDEKRAFTLTLQTREQHIRRGKATSNICTNQQLLSLGALVHLASLGPEGFRRAALLTQERALRLRDALGAAGAEFPFPETPFFREFVVRIPEPLVAALLEERIVPGISLEGDYPEYGSCRLVAVTEKRSLESIDRFAVTAGRFMEKRTGGRHADSAPL